MYVKDHKQFHILSSKHAGYTHDQSYWSSLGKTSPGPAALQSQAWSGEVPRQGPRPWPRAVCPGTAHCLSKDAEETHSLVFKLCSGAADPEAEPFILESALLESTLVVQSFSTSSHCWCCVWPCCRIIRQWRMCLAHGILKPTNPTFVAFFFRMQIILYSYELFSIQCHWISSFLSYYVLPLLTLLCSLKCMSCPAYLLLPVLMSKSKRVQLSF